MLKVTETINEDGLESLLREAIKAVLAGELSPEVAQVAANLTLAKCMNTNTQIRKLLLEQRK